MFSQEDEAFDPAKRMRFTPQPQAAASSQNHDVTHISDSMPGTALGSSDLHEQLEETSKALEKERASHKELRRLFRQNQRDWDKQQAAHEALSESYRKCTKELETTKTQLEAAERKVSSLSERLDAKNEGYRALLSQFKALQETQLMSEDAKVAEIAQLRKEVADAKEAEKRAINNKKSAEDTREYATVQLNEARDAATAYRLQVDELTAENASLKPKATGEMAALARQHYETQARLGQQREERLQTQNRVYERRIKELEDERANWQRSRGVGAGTRAQSVGPKTPRPGSRAASPMPGYRDRLSNLRNG